MNQLNLQNRAHLFAISATCMRRILVDYAKAKSTHKRGGGLNMFLLMKCR
ncbi:MAG: hypothetical protein IPJ30_26495 [Acidobacteria bacterium]|nr:hypothetical protein [Acidobacteriota bacterium]